MPARHLYVHVPFCARKCSYCDFAIAVRRVVPVDDFLQALEKELAAIPDSAHAPLETVYFGGGTPSRLGPAGIRQALGLIRKRFDIARGAEITMEANPEDVSKQAAREWKKAGINRLSIGIQSFDDAVLQWMHRVHDAERARVAIEDARGAGFRNISIDLIFALPRQLNRSWESDLAAALSLRPNHISLYGLTVEKATPVARWAARGEIIPADEDLYAEEFLLAHSMAAAAGFEHYEVSNFALPGSASRHNSAYWTGVAYLGVGPSAHSFDGSVRTWNVAAYADWLARIGRGQTVVAGAELLTAENRAAEDVYLGLRTIGGYRAGASDLTSAAAWEKAGWARIDDGVIRLEPEGWLRLDSLAAGLTGF